MLYNRSNTIFLRREITVENTIKALKNLQRGGQNLFIESMGGNFSATEICFQHLMPKKITVIGGEIISSAALGIFLCGDYRIALPNSKFLFHEVWMVYEGRTLRETEIELKLEIAILTRQYDVAKYFAAVLRECRAANRQNARFFSQRTKMSFERAYKYMRGEGIVLTVQEARFYGIVHEIIPRASVEV